ncbi:hypothetical protein WH47_11709 [Habropoda laboriosa]|uniref:Uncharacterized protein n=1 Tax=Habropoda laboriosa TaxID=597456 RepID=A0A0L7R8G8_9HYME|nr:hypothetical protein WH47_11709 [Habropoda laboriosa]
MLHTLILPVQKIIEISENVVSHFVFSLEYRSLTSESFISICPPIFIHNVLCFNEQRGFNTFEDL